MSFGLGDALSIGADLLGIKSDSDSNKANIAFQKEFARRGIQWKANDARKAGIHPLYAMGASTNMPTYNIQGQGDAIRNIGQKFANKELTELQKKNVQADIALKMAQASAVAKRTQNLNSNQDNDIVQAQELEPARVKVSERHGLKHGKGGRLIKSQLGNFLFKNNQPSSQAFEDETGEAVSIVASTMESAKAWGRFKQLQSEAKRRYPEKKAGNTRGYKRNTNTFNAKQRRRQAIWLNKRVQIFLKTGD